MGEPAKVVEKSPSGVSQHLARLRMARMVTTRQDGTKVLYTLIARHPKLALGLSDFETGVAVMPQIRNAIRQADHTIASGNQIPRPHAAQG